MGGYADRDLTPQKRVVRILLECCLVAIFLVDCPNLLEVTFRSSASSTIVLCGFNQSTILYSL